MATEEELRLRRGKRGDRPKAPSPRHRGRLGRARRTKKARRKKGDKSKNAKMGTMVVMYTLHRSEERGLLLGPINKRYYASFAQKRHAFEYAQREATRRGFPPGTKRTVQIVTDGDNDLARYSGEFFPHAIHTLDAAHVVEKLWDAGASVHREGSAECQAWVDAQKAALYGGKVHRIIAELERQLARIPTTGPGNKYRRAKLAEIHDYLDKRRSNVNYAELRREDLEIGSGQVEGAIKALMYRRMDQGGMRWIKERAETVLQLRCIDANGEWEAFVDYVHRKARDQVMSTGTRPRLQQAEPESLPEITLPAAA